MLNIRGLFESMCTLCAPPPLHDVGHAVFAGPDEEPKGDGPYGFYYYEIRRPGNSGAAWSWARTTDAEVINILQHTKPGQVISLREGDPASGQAQTISRVDVLSDVPLYRIPKDLPPFLNLDEAYTGAPHPGAF